MQWTFVLLVFALPFVSAGKGKDKVSYTFVIDTTGSMSEEIADVRSGVFDIIKKIPSRVTYFIFVPFNDPFDASKIVKTKKESEIKNSLNRMTASGGGDCPEPGFEALKKAIEKSERSSPVYYFSDALPKNPALLSEIKTAAKDKDISLYLMLTGCCYTYCLADHYSDYKSLIDYVGRRIYKLTKRSYVRYWMRLLKKITDMDQPNLIYYAPTLFSEIKSAIDRDELPGEMARQGHAGTLSVTNCLVFIATVVAATWTLAMY